MSAYETLVENLEYEIYITKDFLSDARLDMEVFDQQREEHDNYAYTEAWEEAKSKADYHEAYLAGLNEAYKIVTSMEADFANEYNDYDSGPRRRRF